MRFEDVLWPQYRELGCFLYRGFTIQNITDQCMSTKYETGKGRQMPVHYCFPEGNIHAVTSPLGTKIPQASGAGYGMRVDGRDECAVVYFGDGAASEGDFAVGLNFAATLKSQTMFICRNNGYAISTPVSEQYAGDGGIVARGIAYGIPSIRVDGNCVLSVHLATKRAREICIKEKRPVLLELMTFRRGHHSTSDDSSRYRDNSGDDWQYWTRPDIEPISRYKELLKKHGVCAPTHGDLDTYEKEYRQSIRNEVLQSLKLSESKKRAPIMEMFKDVYHDIPPHLKEQQELLQKHLQDNKERYGNETMNIYEEGEEH